MNRLKIAIQKSGRLNEDSLKLLRDSGISINNGHDQLKVSSTNFPLEIFFLRNSDIPQYLIDGVVDIAILGNNLLAEYEQKIDIVQNLGFSKCRVSIAVPNKTQYDTLEDLREARIATSYPNIVKKYFDSKGVPISIHTISGSVEIAPNIGLADAIVDIVSTGSTLFKNNLKEVELILESEAVLAVSPKLHEDQKITLEKLLFRLRSVLEAKNSRYILMNVPNDKINVISAILPVLKSPTIIPLVEEGWSSLHSVINEHKFWDIIDRLKEEGAEGILICPIEKIVL